jgi:hypothetical protein
MVSVAQAEAITVERNAPMLRREKIRETRLSYRDAATRTVDKEDGVALADIEDVNTPGSSGQERSARAPGAYRLQFRLDSVYQNPPSYEEQGECQARAEPDRDQYLHVPLLRRPAITGYGE